MTLTTRSIHFVSVSLALIVLSLTTAAAQDAEEARRHFDRAETAYKLGRYTLAIREYEAAYKAMPDAAFLFNIAQAHRQQFYIDRKAGNLQKALALYKTYLRETKKPPNRTMVLKLIDELKGVLTAVESRRSETNEGKLLLGAEGSSVGASVSIDGKAVGKLPLSRKLVAGAYVVKVERENYRPWSMTVTIVAGRDMEIPVKLIGADQNVDPAPVATSAPLYRRWWFWTAVGVVAAGAGVGIYLGTRDSGTSLPQIDLR